MALKNTERNIHANQERQPNSRRSLPKLIPYLLFLPAALLLIVILIYPLLQTLYMSFWRWPALDPSRVNFVGFDNYVRLFTRDERFLTSLAFTLKFTVATIGLEFLLGLAGALVLERIRVWRGVVSTIVILPYLVAPIAVGLTWRLIWARDFGLANYLLSLVSIGPINWLADGGAAFWATVITEVWRSTPFVTLILLAGLTTIPNELFDASRVDGASPWQVFRNIKLPLLAPSIAVALIFQTIFKLRLFDLVFTLTGGGPGNDTTPLGLLIQRTYFRSFEAGYSSAISVVLLILGALVSIIYIRLVYREVQY
jgi:multiple sugar transport system permease protein